MSIPLIKVKKNTMEQYIKQHPWIFVMLFIALTLIINIWGQTISMYINKEFNTPAEKLKVLLVLAIVLSITFYLVIKKYHIPLTQIHS